VSWAIERDGRNSVVVLPAELTIQHAAEFYQAVLPLAGCDGAVRIDASASRSIHTAILQILHALAQAAPDFAVLTPSAEFRAAERRVGFSLAKHPPTPISDRPSGRT
jgi:anti-anti-sigma regulatory factor